MVEALQQTGSAGSAGRPVNERVAARLDEVAHLLEAQGASPFRVMAWRRGAEVLRGLDRDVAGLLSAHGRPGLEALPGIGESLAGAIAQLVETGRLPMLDRLRGDVGVEDLIASLPGIGPALAQRIHETLGIETLEELETAAWDGRLARVPGFGERRIAAVRAVLDERLGRSRRRFRPAATEPPDRPTVADLLSVDAEYRAGAAAGTLRRIAPRRFNPTGEAWLPILHTQRGPWAMHALFSNTGRAHQLGRTRDWVVVYYERNGDEGQATVVTEPRGPLAGRRVVRGRERECERYYGERSQPARRRAGGTASAPSMSRLGRRRLDRFLLR